MILPHPLILASASPGRAELLRAAGYTFEQKPTGVHEPDPASGADPVGHARLLARLKADAGAARHAARLVLAADTVIFCDGRFLGKPADAAEAVEMLTFLGGRAHTIVSALCLALALPGRACRFESGEDTARVTLRAWPRERLMAHVAEVKPLFCAGAYAVQGGGAAIVARLEGDPSTVIGLPLDLLDNLLRRFN
jgi:septum formation protein